jgi:VWFA-related protein
MGEDKPIDMGTTEKVEVRLVTVQVLVLDRKNRTVPGLTAEDFDVTVDGTPVPVDTLDVSCPLGMAEDPKAASASAVRQAPTAGPAERRIVLVFDYFHVNMSQETREEALTGAVRMVRSRAAPGDEIMVVAFANGVRIEQPFTKDHDEVLGTLARMRRDTTLYAGYYFHTTEHQLFGSLEGLLTVLATVPQPKALVLFTAGPGPGTGFYDLSYRKIAALASSAATVIYPVNTEGLVPGMRFT